MKKICILGASLDTGNMGVSALSVSLIENIIERIPDAEIYLIISHHEPNKKQLKIGNKEITVTSLNWRLSPRSRPSQHLLWIYFLAILYRIFPFRGIRSCLLKGNPLLKAIAEADFIGDIFGGDSFSDIYGVPRFLIHIIENLVVILLKKKFVFLPQTYGPYSSRVAKSRARFLMKKADSIISRDQASMELVKSLLKKEKYFEKIIFCPDVAFKLKPHPPTSPEINPSIELKLEQKFIGINVSGLLYAGGYTGKNMFGLNFDYRQFVNQLLLTLLEQTEAPLLLIPHTYARPGNVEDDKSACLTARDELPEELRKRVHVVISPHNQNEVKGIIGFCDFFIGSRMHSCIGAISQGIPTIGVAYSKKFKGVFRSIDCEHMVVDACSPDMSVEKAITVICEVYKRRAEERAHIQENLARARQRLTEVFNEILS